MKKTLNKIHDKLSRTKGRKMAAHDIKVMITTAELRKWVNAQRRAILATKRANAEQVKREALGINAQDQGQLQGLCTLGL